MSRTLLKFTALLAIAAQAGLATPAAADPKDDAATQEIARRTFLRTQWPTG